MNGQRTSGLSIRTTGPQQQYQQDVSFSTMPFCFSGDDRAEEEPILNRRMLRLREPFPVLQASGFHYEEVGLLA